LMHLPLLEGTRYRFDDAPFGSPRCLKLEASGYRLFCLLRFSQRLYLFVYVICIALWRWILPTKAFPSLMGGRHRNDVKGTHEFL